MRAIVIGLSAIVALAFLGLVSPGSAQAKGCGRVLEQDFRLTVDKGNVGCKKARGIVKRFANTTNCGAAMTRACVVGKYHCRNALPGEGNLAGYCYILKDAEPAPTDFSFYKLEKFKVAIALRL